jgi:hypothetical protein
MPTAFIKYSKQSIFNVLMPNLRAVFTLVEIKSSYLYIKNTSQYSASYGGGRRPVNGLHHQPCSHQLTARVGHSRGFFCHFDVMTMDKAKTKYGRVPSNKIRRA